MTRKATVLALAIFTVLVLLGVRRFTARARTPDGGEVNAESNETFGRALGSAQRGPEVEPPQPPAEQRTPVAQSSSTTAVADGAAPSAKPAEFSLKCPSERPTSGQPCGLNEMATVRCLYGQEPSEEVCDCVTEQTTSVWRCSGVVKAEPPPPCPLSQPDNGGSCRSYGNACAYGVGIDSIVCQCGLPNSPTWSCMTYRDWRGPK